MKNLSSALRLLSKLGEGEQVFVLRAKDKFAVPTIQFWLGQLLSELPRHHPGEYATIPLKNKVEEIRRLCAEMEVWGAANGTRVPD